MASLTMMIYTRLIGSCVGIVIGLCPGLRKVRWLKEIYPFLIINGTTGGIKLDLSKSTHENGDLIENSKRCAINQFKDIRLKVLSQYDCRE